MSSMNKFNKLIDRLEMKVKLSATPVKGFEIGLSGTDSMVTTILLNEVANRIGFKINAIHCTENDIETSFMKSGASDWISKNLTNVSYCIFDMSNVGNHDQFRWAQLHYDAVRYGYWVASTVNATEKALGTYSIMAKSASIEPIASLYKSEVLDICAEYKIPDKLIKNSRIPDCACGRDEFAAENIELIDSLLRNQIPEKYTLNEVQKGMNYIKENRHGYGFKERTPYSV